MENFKDQLQALLSKTNWTREEKQQLLTYLEGADTNELKALMQTHFEQEPVLDSNDHVALHETLAMIHERLGFPTPRGVIDGRKRFFSVLAAASILGLMVIAGYLFSFRHSPAQLAVSKKQAALSKHDVLPGGNNATLTLADGSTLVLNNEQNGVLAAQGNTKVLKLNGRLTYQPSDSGAKTGLYNTIATPRGGQYQVVLADGSSVWLNAASSLRFPTNFVGKERRVEVKGEAYFEVAKNKAMPFVVVANGAEVQVLGTHFNVKAYDDEAVLRTTLLEGSVKFVSGSNTVTLKPGQQSRLKENGGVDVVNGIDVDKVVAWKNGYFDFDGESLETITKQLARWYDVEVVGTARIADQFYAEIPRSTKLSDVLHALELTGKVHFQIDGKKVTVTP